MEIEREQVHHHSRSSTISKKIVSYAYHPLALIFLFYFLDALVNRMECAPIHTWWWWQWWWNEKPVTLSFRSRGYLFLFLFFWLEKSLSLGVCASEWMNEWCGKCILITIIISDEGKKIWPKIPMLVVHIRNQQEREKITQKDDPSSFYSYHCWWCQSKL